MNILLTIAYNGAAYHGFQVQQNALAVCTVLQDAMLSLFGSRPDVKGCSRTDAGVHARAFCLNFHQETAISMDKLPLALNSFLPSDIRVRGARQVPEGFHARYDALGKAYCYNLLQAPVDDVFLRGQYYRVAGPLDVSAMQAAAGFLVGRHDFTAFQSAGSKAGDTVRCVQSAAVTCSGDWVRFTVAADGFLYNMVRIMAGTLVAVGRGQMQPDEVPAILESRDRARAGDTLPACGLFLEEVFYPEHTLAL